MTEEEYERLIINAGFENLLGPDYFKSKEEVIRIEIINAILDSTLFYGFRASDEENGKKVIPHLSALEKKIESKKFKPVCHHKNRLFDIYDADLSVLSIFDEEKQKFLDEIHKWKLNAEQYRYDELMPLMDQIINEIKAQATSEVEWIAFSKTYKPVIEAKQFYKNRSPEEIKIDKRKTINLYDYIKIFKEAFNEVGDRYKEKVRREIMVKEREYIIARVNYYKKGVGLCNDGSSEYAAWAAKKYGENWEISFAFYDQLDLVEIYNDESISNLVKFVAEGSAFYSYLNAFRPTNEDEIQEPYKGHILNYCKIKAEIYCRGRSKNEIERDKNLFVIKSDYQEYCWEAFKDVLFRSLYEEQSKKDQLEKELSDYYERQMYGLNNSNENNYSKYGEASDGYGGFLKDDFIDDAFGGVPDAIWNID